MCYNQYLWTLHSGHSLPRHERIFKEGAGQVLYDYLQWRSTYIDSNTFADVMQRVTYVCRPMSFLA
jgi:hypothetical protein